MINKCTAYSLDFELDIHITIHYVVTETQNREQILSIHNQVEIIRHKN